MLCVTNVYGSKAMEDFEEVYHREKTRLQGRFNEEMRQLAEFISVPR